MPSLLAQRFLRHTSHYESHAIIQHKMALELITMCKDITPTPRYIFEFGCGIGSYTKLLHRIYPKSLFVCNDINDYTHIFQAMPNVKFLCFDMENVQKALQAQDTTQFHLITANATLQWLNQTQCLQALPQFLYPQGYILLSSFGTQNFWQIKELCGVGLEYLSLETYQEILSPYFEIVTLYNKIHTLCFDSALEVFRHLHFSGVNGIQKDFFLSKKLLYEYTQKFANTLTYDCVFICAKKKD